MMTLTLYDRQRRRYIPLEIFVPKRKTARPLVIFSHGHRVTSTIYHYLGRFWQRHGFVCVFPIHRGRSESMGARNFFTDRALDVVCILDSLKKIENEIRMPIDRDSIGVAGHSLGAHTALTLGGQKSRLKNGALSDVTDSRIAAVIAIAPPTADELGLRKYDAARMKVPLMVVNGKWDKASGRTFMPRKEIYRRSGSKSKVHVLFTQATHGAFTTGAFVDRRRRIVQFPDPKVHAALAQNTLAFFSIHLLERAAAGPVSQKSPDVQVEFSKLYSPKRVW